MAHWLEVPATKAGDLNSIPETHMGRREPSHKLSLDLCMCTMEHVPNLHTPINVIVTIMIIMIIKKKPVTSLILSSIGFPVASWKPPKSVFSDSELATVLDAFKA